MGGVGVAWCAQATSYNSCALLAVGVANHLLIIANHALTAVVKNTTCYKLKNEIAARGAFSDFYGSHARRVAQNPAPRRTP